MKLLKHKFLKIILLVLFQTIFLSPEAFDDNSRQTRISYIQMKRWIALRNEKINLSVAKKKPIWKLAPDFCKHSISLLQKLNIQHVTIAYLLGSNLPLPRRSSPPPIKDYFGKRFVWFTNVLIDALVTCNDDVKYLLNFIQGRHQDREQKMRKIWVSFPRLDPYISRTIAPLIYWYAHNLEKAQNKLCLSLSQKGFSFPKNISKINNYSPIDPVVKRFFPNFARDFINTLSRVVARNEEILTVLSKYKETVKDGE